ncbi:hypothetical protein [Burkholderia gladioli]|nr:hypothetical protein [Burkholderia gladioli]
MLKTSIFKQKSLSMSSPEAINPAEKQYLPPNTPSILLKKF